MKSVRKDSISKWVFYQRKINPIEFGMEGF